MGRYRLSVWALVETDLRLVGGTNVAVFKNTENLDGAVDLVKFMTSAEQQSTLNTAYGTIPAGKDAAGAAFDTPKIKIARDTIAAALDAAAGKVSAAG